MLVQLCQLGRQVFNLGFKNKQIENGYMVTWSYKQLSRAQNPHLPS